LGLHSYHYSLRLSRYDLTFESLIFAAISKSDWYNGERLRLAFPELFAEMRARYEAPGGVISGDGKVDMEALARHVHDLFYPEESE
jgi:hypothetical protein